MKIRGEVPFSNVPSGIFAQIRVDSRENPFQSSSPGLFVKSVKIRGEILVPDVSFPLLAHFSQCQGPH